MRRPSLAWLVLASLAACDPSGSGTDDTAGSDEPAGVAYHLEPASGARGTAMTVRLVGTYSTFVFGDTFLSLGEGITIVSTTVLDGWTTKVDIEIAGDAALGPRDAVIALEGREITLPDAFTVVPESFVIDPDNGKMGEMLEVAIVGQSTAWESGYTWTSFGEGVEILDLDVLSETLAVARIAIYPDAPPGVRDVAMETGPQVTWLFDGFTVDRAVITAEWEPPEAYQGATVAYTVTGLDTNFGADTTIEFWDDGGENADIQVTELTVLDAQNLYGRIRLSNAARLGYRDVILTSNDESILLPDALEVLDAPPNLTNIVPRTFFDVFRVIDNETGELVEQVDALAYFIIPLDPPCGAASPMGQGPMPYDANGVWPTPPPRPPVDCPVPETVSAGDYVWYESPSNIVTLHKDEQLSTGQILYRGLDLTLDDYVFDNVYDLHTQGDPDGVPEVLVEDVQPTVPGDYYLLEPALWGDFTQARTADFQYRWTPAQTYPDAIFGTSINGTLTVDLDGDGQNDSGFAGSIPWDDGVHTYRAGELSQLDPGPVTFVAYSYIEGRYWGLPFSTVQTVQSNSTLQTQATMVLE